MRKDHFVFRTCVKVWKIEIFWVEWVVNVYVCVCLAFLAGWRASTWLPFLSFVHFGLGVCGGNGSIGCTNNNYASREKCKKCGQPKEVAAVPAIAMPGVFVGSQGGLQPRMGLLGSSTFQQSLQPSSAWSLGAFAPNTNNLVQLSSVPKDWRNGDWICNCGFHNYSSRAQCKKCNAAPPVALGIKRLATDELVHAWDSKRLNAGAGPEQSYSAFGPVTGFIGDQLGGLHATYPSGSTPLVPNMQGAMHLPQPQIAPALVGKGAKHWREGDWMCSNCNNHNYASRSECNRCKTQKTSAAQSVGVA